MSLGLSFPIGLPLRSRYSAAPTSLFPSMTSYWAMEEGLGANRLDHYTRNTLVQVRYSTFPGPAPGPQVAQGVGRIDFGAVFVSDSSNDSGSDLEVATPDGLNGPGHLAVGGFFKMDYTDPGRDFVFISKGTSATPEYYLYYDGNHGAFRFWNNFNSVSTWDADSPPTVVADTWYQVIGEVDAVAQTQSIILDGVVIYSADISPFSPPSVTDGPFYVGSYLGENSFFSGTMDEVWVSL